MRISPGGSAHKLGIGLFANEQVISKADAFWFPVIAGGVLICNQRLAIEASPDCFDVERQLLCK